MTKMMTIRERLRAALRRPAQDPPTSLFPVKRPAGVTCRCCEGRAEVQVSPELAEAGSAVPSEFLCWECLGTFVRVFADPRVATWSVTRL